MYDVNHDRVSLGVNENMESMKLIRHNELNELSCVCVCVCVFVRVVGVLAIGRFILRPINHFLHDLS